VTVVLALVVVATVVTLLAPVVLTRGVWWVRHPRLALRSWLVALTVAAGSLLSSVVTAAVIVATDAHVDGVGAPAAGLFAWCGLGVAGGVGALLAANAEPISAAKQRSDVAVTILVARATVRTERIGGQEVAYVATAEPIACSTADGRVLIATGVEAAMPRACVRAVIEHERAHVLGRHDLIRRVAALNAAAFPRLRTAREFRRTVALLIELVADDAAARVCGPATVCNALALMDRIDPDPGLHLRAARLAGARVATWQHRRRLVPVLPSR
jgi:Zn-dependent protease with chaperone function